MIAYHVTTEKKLARYKSTGAILPPVRFWSTLEAATRWARKTGRDLLARFDAPCRSWPLPIKGGAWWTDQIIMIQDISVEELSGSHPTRLEFQLGHQLGNQLKEDLK